MKRNVVKVFIIMLSLAALSMAAIAQETKMPDDKTKVSHDKMKADHKDHTSKVEDKEFVNKVAMSGMTEVELGQLVVGKTSNEDVKAFAQRMIDDHSKGNEELKTLAASKNITLPAAIGSKEKKMIDDLSKLTGEKFDREYIEEMVEAHDKNVVLFEKEASKGKDAETKAWAEQKLPTLREHQKMARDIATKLGVKISPMKADNK
jgi:putative membrane protein